MVAFEAVTDLELCTCTRGRVPTPPLSTSLARGHLWFYCEIDWRVVGKSRGGPES